MHENNAVYRYSVVITLSAVAVQYSREIASVPLNDITVKAVYNREITLVQWRAVH